MTDEGRSSLARECLAASIGILLLLGALKHLAPIWPPWGLGLPLLDVKLSLDPFTIAAVAQLCIPIYLIGRRVTEEEMGFHTSRWKRDVVLAIVLGAATIIPFAIGHHLWQTLLFGRTFRPAWPDDFPSSIAIQVVAVALPEELYFRGYLQGRMQRLWPPAFQFLGVPVGRALAVASAVFALAHFVGEYNPVRLGPFFPALVFGWLRARPGASIVAPVIYHAFCNILGDVLWACYRP